MCDDALTVNRVVTSRGVSTREPFVGNGLWVVEVSDADGYRLAFESPADSPEDTTLSEINSGHEPVDRYGDQK